MRCLPLLLIFLSTSFLGIGQCKHPDLKIFEDYTECFSGLQNSKGEVILEAEYESISVCGYADRKSFFLIEKHGLQGVIDCDLKVIFPAEYSTISRVNEVKNELIFSVSKNNLFGIADKSGRIIVPIEYQQIQAVQLYSKQKFKARYWIVKKEGRFGLLDSEGKTIYDNNFVQLSLSINPGNNRWYRNASRTNEQLELLLARSENGKVGLLTFQGDTLLGFEYNAIEPQTFSAGNFIVGKTDSEMRVFDTLGNLIDARDNASRVTVNWFNIDSKNISPFIQYSLDDPERSTVIVNIESGKMVQINGTLTLRHGIITQSQSNAILNQHLDTIKLLGAKEIRWDNALSEEGLNVYTYKNGEEITGIFNENGVHLFEAPNSKAYVTGESKGLKIWLRQQESTLGNAIKSQKGSLTIMDRNGKIIKNWPIESCLGIGSFVNRYQQTPHRSNSYIKLDNNQDALLLIQSNGKFGAIDHSANVIIPFEYDEFLSYHMNGKNILGYYFRKNGKKGVVSTTGKIITPFVYDDFVANFEGTAYHIMERDGQYTVVNESGKIVIENVENVFASSKPSYLSWSESEIQNRKSNYLKNETRFFIEIKGYIYLAVNDEIYKYDTVNFAASSFRPVIDKFLISKNGKIMHRSNHAFSNYGNFAIAYSNKNVRTIYSKSTFEPLLILDSIQNMTNDYRGVIVRFENDKMGLLDKEGDTWILKPEYYWIAPTADASVYWVKTTPVTERKYNLHSGTQKKDLSGGWSLINVFGEILTGDIKMMAPAHSSQGNDASIIYAEDSLAGLLVNDSIAVPLEFDYIEKSRQGYFWFLFKNGKIQLYSTYFGLSEAYDRISPRSFGRVYIAQKGRSYSIFTLGNSIEYLVKDVPEEVFLRYNFLRLSQVASVRKEIPKDFIQVSDSSSLEPFWPQKNEQARWVFFATLHENNFKAESYRWSAPDYFSDNTTYSYAQSIVQSNAYQRIPHDIKFTPAISFEKEAFPTMRAIYYNNLVYTKQLTKPEVTSGRASVNWQSTYTHFVQLEDRIDTVGLYDFFSNDAKTKEFIYSYLENEINERQIFGIACPNLPQVIQELESQWHFYKTGIVFQGTSGKNFTIEISYKELKKHVNPRYRAALKQLKKEAKEYEKKRNKRHRPRWL